MPTRDLDVPPRGLVRSTSAAALAILQSAQQPAGLPIVPGLFDLVGGGPLLVDRGRIVGAAGFISRIYPAPGGER